MWTIGQNGVLYGLDPATGQVRQQVAIGVPANHFPTPSVADGLLLAACAQNVVALSAPGSGAATAAAAAGPEPEPGGDGRERGAALPVPPGAWGAPSPAGDRRDRARGDGRAGRPGLAAPAAAVPAENDGGHQLISWWPPSCA